MELLSTIVVQHVVELEVEEIAIKELQIHILVILITIKINETKKKYDGLSKLRETIVIFHFPLLLVRDGAFNL